MRPTPHGCSSNGSTRLARRGPKGKVRPEGDRHFRDELAGSWKYGQPCRDAGRRCSGAVRVE